MSSFIVHVQASGLEIGNIPVQAYHNKDAHIATLIYSCAALRYYPTVSIVILIWGRCCCPSLYALSYDLDLWSDCSLRPQLSLSHFGTYQGAHHVVLVHHAYGLHNHFHPGLHEQARGNSPDGLIIV